MLTTLFTSSIVATADQVVMARQLSKADGRLDWNQSARELHNRVRGVQPWPGAHTLLAGQPFKIHRSAVVDPGSGSTPDTEPGQVIEQPDKVGSAVPIVPVCGGVLGHQHKLLYPGSQQLLRFGAGRREGHAIDEAV